MLEEFEFDSSGSDDEASIPTPVSLSPFIDSNRASPRASPIRAPFGEVTEQDEKVDSVFYDTVSQRLADYVAVISDRLRREGNYA